MVQRCFLSQIMQVLRCLSFDTENETFLLDNLNLEFMSISSNTFSHTECNFLANEKLYEIARIYQAKLISYIDNYCFLYSLQFLF